MQDYDIKFALLTLSGLIMFVIRVQIFMIWTQFTPAFLIKSNVSDKGRTAEIIGVNKKGIEIFKYELFDEETIERLLQG